MCVCVCVWEHGCVIERWTNKRKLTKLEVCERSPFRNEDKPNQKLGSFFRKSSNWPQHQSIHVLNVRPTTKTILCLFKPGRKARPGFTNMSHCRWLLESNPSPLDNKPLKFYFSLRQFSELSRFSGEAKELLYWSAQDWTVTKTLSSMHLLLSWVRKLAGDDIPCWPPH